MTDKQIETFIEVSKQVIANDEHADTSMIYEIVGSMKLGIEEDKYKYPLRGFLTHPSTLKAVWGDRVDRFYYATNEKDDNKEFWIEEHVATYIGHQLSEIVDNSAILDYYALNMPKEEV